MTVERPLRVSVDATAVPDRPVGVGRFLLDLGTALSQRADLEIFVVCGRGDGPRWRGIGATVVSDVAPRRRPLRLAWEQIELPRVLSRLNVEVHHGPHYTMPERARVPKVVSIHDMTFFDHPEWHERAKVMFFRRAIRVAAAHADAIVTASRSAARRIEAVLRPRAPLHVIPHGVDGDRFRPVDPDDAETGERDRAVLARLGVEAPYVAFVGTLEPRKDVPSLVRAFDRVASKQHDISLVLAGGRGWGAEEVDAAVAECAHGERVVRLGYVAEDDKVALVRAAAALAYPSREEGFGLPVLEALACGTPLVTTAGSAMEEVVAGAALLVPASDVPALADAIEAVLAGGPEVEGRRERGLEVAGRHTWDASAAAYVAVYEAVAHGAS